MCKLNTDSSCEKTLYGNGCWGDSIWKNFIRTWHETQWVAAKSSEDRLACFKVMRCWRAWFGLRTWKVVEGRSGVMGRKTWDDDRVLQHRGLTNQIRFRTWRITLCVVGKPLKVLGSGIPSICVINKKNSVWGKDRHRTFGASLVVQTVESLPAMWSTQFDPWVQEDSLEKETATHSTILAWEIPWTEMTEQLIVSYPLFMSSIKKKFCVDKGLHRDK